MLRSLLYIVFCFLPLLGMGQITVSSEAIAEVGDTLDVVVDNLPQDIDVGSPGENKIWDFSSLQGMFAQNQVFESPNKGTYAALFPRADLFVNAGGNVELYFDNVNGQLRELGIVTPDPTGIVGTQVSGQYSTPYEARRAPLTYGDQQFQHTSLLITLDGEVLPDTLLAMLPAAPDSVRIRTEIIRMDEVDAWGSLIMPVETFDVIREKRVEQSSFHVDVLTFLGWIEVTELLAGFFPVGQLGDTTTTYHYFDETSEEPIALVTVDEADNAINAAFQRPRMLTSYSDVQLKNAHGIFASPNPAPGFVRFSFANLDPGKYHLKVTNIIGKTVWETTEIIEGDKTIQVDLTHLRRGTYLYALSDANNKRLFTKRLVIVNP